MVHLSRTQKAGTLAWINNQPIYFGYKIITTIHQDDNPTNLAQDQASAQMDSLAREVHLASTVGSLSSSWLCLEYTHTRFSLRIATTIRTRSISWLIVSITIKSMLGTSKQPFLMGRQILLENSNNQLVPIPSIE
jgi:hypothetical protein